MRIKLLAIYFCLAHAAYSMQCEIKPVEENVKNADAIFEGRISSRKLAEPKTDGRCWKYSEEKPNCGGKTVEIEVTKVWKGQPAKKIRMWSEDGCYCLGHYFTDENGKYIFFAKTTADAELVKQKVDFTSRVCDGSVSLDSDHGKKQFAAMLKALHALKP